MTHPTNSIDSELEELGRLFANRIGSPYGEGATYSHSQAEPEDDDKPRENGRLYSHLDDPDFELFVKDFVQAIKSKYISRKEIEEAIRTTKLEQRREEQDNDWFYGSGNNHACEEIAAKLLPPTKGGNDILGIKIVEKDWMPEDKFALVNPPKSKSGEKNDTTRKD